MEGFIFDSSKSFCIHEEIKETLLQGQTVKIKIISQIFRIEWQDRPDIVARVFKMKLDSLLEDLTKKHVIILLIFIFNHMYVRFSEKCHLGCTLLSNPFLFEMSSFIC